MVSKALFGDFASATSEGVYFLRADFIKAVFLLGGTSGLPGGHEVSAGGLNEEKLNDKEIQVTCPHAPSRTAPARR